MSDEGKKLLDASELGAKKLQVPNLGPEAKMRDGSPAIGVDSTYDDSATTGDTRYASASNLKLKIAVGDVNVHPRQRFGGRGTTIFNPKPEDIEVEAINGPLKYNPKIEVDSKEELLKKNTEQGVQLGKLVARLDMMESALSGGLPITQSGGTTAPETMTETIPYNTLKWIDLRKEAASRGINTHGKKAANLIGELIEQDGGNTS